MIETHCHLDYLKAEPLEEILKKIKEVNKQNLPVLLTGDFNLEEDSESIQLISVFL